MENDGFDLGAQRREIAENDLPKVREELGEYLGRLRAGSDGVAEPRVEYTTTLGLVAEKEKIAAGGEYNLSGERYRETINYASMKWPMVELGDVCDDILSGGTPSTKNEAYWNGDIPWITSADIVNVKTAKPRKYITEEAISESATNLIKKGNVIVVTRVGLGKLFRNDFDVCISQDSQGLILKDAVNADYLVYVLKDRVENFKKVSQGSTIQGVTKGQLSEIQIPLPPLEVQREIVAEIEGYQRVIDGARAVIDNYRPQIVVDPEWPMVKVGSLAEIVRGSSPRPKGDPDYYGGPIPRLMVADITRDGMYATPQIDSLTYEGAKKSRPMKKGDVIITVSGNPGLPTILAKDACIHDGFVGLRNLKIDLVLPEHLYFDLLSRHEIHGSQSVGAVFKNLTTHQIRDFEIPLPPLETQQAIVAEIEAEQSLVAANRELVKRMEDKIRAAIGRVWGGDDNAEVFTISIQDSEKD